MRCLATATGRGRDEPDFPSFFVLLLFPVKSEQQTKKLNENVLSSFISTKTMANKIWIQPKIEQDVANDIHKLNERSEASPQGILLEEFNFRFASLRNI